MLQLKHSVKRESGRGIMELFGTSRTNLLPRLVLSNETLDLLDTTHSKDTHEHLLSDF